MANYQPFRLSVGKVSEHWRWRLVVETSKFQQEFGFPLAHSASLQFVLVRSNTSACAKLPVNASTGPAQVSLEAHAAIKAPRTRVAITGGSSGNRMEIIKNLADRKQEMNAEEECLSGRLTSNRISLFESFGPNTSALKEVLLNEEQKICRTKLDKNVLILFLKSSENL